MVGYKIIVYAPYADEIPSIAIVKNEAIEEFTSSLSQYDYCIIDGHVEKNFIADESIPFVEGGITAIKIVRETND